ncbi:MAG: extracellular solute-binding protein [Lachnospiraceae bacterium]|jgi:raffinose/stachyose/melibiose transport system substrate-binding protein|nr:extracellular solute-binding protein [Lachnospiraceae bacterium]
MKFKKLSVVMAALLAASSMLAACGGKNETQSTPEAESTEATEQEPAEAESEDAGQEDAASGGEVTLELLLTKSEIVSIMEEIAAKFCEENPGVKIDVTSTGDGATVVRTRAASNELPDIMNTYPAEDFYKDMFRDGYFEDITDAEYLSKVNSTAMEMSNCDGNYYAVPMSLSTYGIYANMDVLGANGITETPSTWEELIADCETLKANGVTAFLLPNKDVGNVAQRFERTAGIINNDTYSEFKKIADGEMEAKDSPTLQTWCDYNEELLNYTADDHMGMDYDIAAAEFSNGNGGFMLSGTWMLATVQKNNPDANVELFAFPHPRGETTKVPVNIDTSFSISSTCKDKEIGLKFLEFMTREDIAQMYCNADGNVSTIEGVEYSIPQHANMKTAVDEGNIFLTAVNFWPTGLREEIRDGCQMFLGDLDRDAFFESSQEAIETIYADN